MALEQFLTSLLTKRNKDFLPLKAVRDALPAEISEDLGIDKKRSTLKQLQEAMEPLVGKHFKILRGTRTLYLVSGLPPEEIVLRQIERTGGLSSKQLKNRLPFKTAEFISAVNRLLERSQVVCRLNESTHIPYLDLPGQIAAEPLPEGDKEMFKRALTVVGQGKQFVRIHKIREYLHWTNTRFNAVIEQLKSELAIQLHAGDPSLLTEEELTNSYTDEKGRVRITVKWMG